MSCINMKNSMNIGFLPLSNAFIERYISKAKAVFVCIYIYSLKKCIDGEKLSLKGTAEEFDILESDVLNAWKFWKKEGIVDFEENEDGFFLEFFDILNRDDKAFDKNENETNEISEVKEIKEAKEANEESDKNCEENEKRTTAFVGTRENMPDYSVEELNVYAENQQIKELFKRAEKAFSSMLDYRKMKLVFSLYDWLGMPVTLIEFLIKYCVSKGKGRSLKYIETVAIDWHERGIDTAYKAQELVRVFDNNYKEIMKELGISFIVPADRQTKFMDDWISKLPLDLIKEACRRTVLKTGKPAFEYADSIIQKWYKQGIKSIEDVEKTDLEFNRNKKEAKDKAQVSKKNTKPNGFVNYEQRTWDFDALNKLKSEMLDKK